MGYDGSTERWLSVRLARAFQTQFDDLLVDKVNIIMSNKFTRLKSDQDLDGILANLDQHL